jgi:glucose/arabinose dehydrogenase
MKYGTWFPAAGLTMAVAGWVTATATAGLRLESIGHAGANALYLTHAPGDPTRLYILLQGSAGTGEIRVYNRLTGTFSSFMSIGNILAGGEQGLLGLAFHPDFSQNGFFYTYTSEPRLLPFGNHDSVVRRWIAASPDAGNPAAGVQFFRFTQDFPNHNGGWIGFGPDGFLYIASGDGGAGGDPFNRAQNINVVLGKLLRIDVDRDDFIDGFRNYGIPPGNPYTSTVGRDEIWHIGLRNPWRCSFDRETGDLYLGDVGQDLREEIDFQHAASTGGINYGWRVQEALNCFDNSQAGGNPPCNSGLLTDPVYHYSTGTGDTQGDSVTGGYVYRGPNPGLQGTYFFGDFENSRIWSIRVNRDTGTMVAGSFMDWTSTLNSTIPGSLAGISSFGEDDEGNLYIVTYGGTIYALVPDPGPAGVEIESIQNDTVTVAIRNLTIGAENTLEQSTDLTDFNGWQEVLQFLTVLGATSVQDAVTGNPEGLFYRLRSESTPP